jgi:hypothetical protein
MSHASYVEFSASRQFTMYSFVTRMFRADSGIEPRTGRYGGHTEKEMPIYKSKHCIDNTVSLESNSANLGDIVRIQPNHLSFSSLEAVEDIHGVRSKAMKSDAYTNIMKSPSLPANIFNTT